MRARFIRLLPAIGVLALGAPTARAIDESTAESAESPPSDRDAPKDPTVEMARARFEEGVLYYDAGRFEAARAAFLQAYALKPHPAVLLNLAQSELRSGRPVEAARRFTEYLTELEDGGSDVQPRSNNDEGRAVAEQGLREAKRLVAELSILVDVDGALLFVDGERLGRAPLATPLFLLPGSHEIRAIHGVHATTKTITVETAQTRSILLNVLPKRTTATVQPLPTAVPERTDTSVEMREPSSFGRWLISSPVGITAVAVTGAGVALGTAGTLVANQRYRAANETTRALVDAAEAENRSGIVCTNGSSPLPAYQEGCSERQRRIDQGDTWRAIAIGGFVGAAAAAAGTIVYYLVGPPARRDEIAPNAVGVTPVVTGQMQGLSVTYAF